MRITGGYCKGRVFKPPKIDGLRPTMEKIRLAVFSMLDNLGGIEGKSILDLYAGSGAYGFEALSRGANEVVFVEREEKLAHFIEQVSETLNFSDKVKIINKSLPAAIGMIVKPVDILFLDPPYDQDPAVVVSGLTERGLLNSGGLIVAETGFKRLPLFPNPLRDKRHGETRITIFRVS